VKRLLLAVLAAAVLCCGHNDSPTDPIVALRTGKLIGLVTIGPNCPGPTTTNPCPTPPSAYASRKVQVFDAAHAKLLDTVDIDNGGFYSILLSPNTYTIDLKPNGIDKSSDVPKQVTIKANDTTRVDIAIDTGIR
jgi:hypothetical protein